MYTNDGGDEHFDFLEKALDWKSIIFSLLRINEKKV